MLVIRQKASPFASYSLIVSVGLPTMKCKPQRPGRSRPNITQRFVDPPGYAADPAKPVGRTVRAVHDHERFIGRLGLGVSAVFVKVRVALDAPENFQ